MKTLVSRISQLDGSLKAQQKRIIDLVMWVPNIGGLFGHAHFFVGQGDGRIEPKSCTDEEELNIMHEAYENNERKVGSVEVVPFSVYLERYSYLGSEDLSQRRDEIIASLKIEEVSKNGEDKTNGSS